MTVAFNYLCKGACGSIKANFEKAYVEDEIVAQNDNMTVCCITVHFKSGKWIQIRLSEELYEREAHFYNEKGLLGSIRISNINSMIETIPQIIRIIRRVSR